MGQHQLLGFLIALLTTAACKEPVTCTTVAVPAISLVVRDSVTGMGLARTARAIARDNAYVDTLRAFSDSVVFGVIERAGTYQVDVSDSGYAAWQAKGVEVVRDECHVHPVVLRVRLMPK